MIVALLTLLKVRKNKGMSAIENDLNLAEGVATEIKRVITPLKYPDDEWSTTVAAFIDQAFEHHAAIILLVRSALFGLRAFAVAGRNRISRSLDCSLCNGCRNKTLQRKRRN